jgi:hypothetical protein
MYRRSADTTYTGYEKAARSSVNLSEAIQLAEYIAIALVMLQLAIV